MQEGTLWIDLWASIYRITVGWLVSTALALPIGILMGNFQFFEGLFEPFVDLVRYMPAVAFVPLTILWLGVGDTQKFAILFIGVFFQEVLLIMDNVKNVPRDLIQVSYTFGLSKWEVLRSVILPAALPGIWDTFRITLGWAWTYLVVAELVAANVGLGYRIMRAQRFLETDQIILGILVIGILGLATDMLFKWSYRRMFPWLAKGDEQRRCEPKLAVERLWKIYEGDKQRGEVVAIEDLSLAVYDNEFVSLVGPSGCGKSTLLMMAAGLEPISAGDIRCDGVPVTGPGRDRGMVFQSYTLFPWLNVADNIRFALKKSGLPRAEQDALVADHIRLVGLEGFEKSHPNQLSGGMRQRVAIARALVYKPADAADGRALWRARRPDASADAGTAAPGLAGAPHHRALRHPRRRRGHPPLRPHLRHDRPARQDQVRNPRRPPPPAQPPRHRSRPPLCAALRREVLALIREEVKP